MLTVDFDLSTQETEVEGSQGGQGQPGLKSKF